MILHFAKENDFKVSQTCLCQQVEREENTLGVTDCLALASVSCSPELLVQGLTLAQQQVGWSSLCSPG